MRSEKWRQTWWLLSFESRALYATVPTPKKWLILGSLDVIIMMNFDFEWSSCGLAVARLIIEPRLETASIFLRCIMTSIVKTELKLTTLTGWRARLISNVHAATWQRHSNALPRYAISQEDVARKTVMCTGQFLTSCLESSHHQEPLCWHLAWCIVPYFQMGQFGVTQTNNRTGIHGFSW